MHRSALPALLLLALAGCSATSPAPEAAPPASAAATGLTVTSTPAAGSTVAGPVNSLMLHFSAPVALGEVTVAGPDGLMPMMLSSAGLQAHYEIPLPGLGAGSYTVNWKAMHAGAERSGSFAFTVR